jgi:hypothetical protein
MAQISFKSETGGEMLRKSMTMVLGLLAGSSLVIAQENAPRRAASPSGSAATQVSGTWSAPDKDGERSYRSGKWVEITYSRPILKGRTSIFGSGADYGKVVNGGAPVWRAGANQTTRLKTEAALILGTKTLVPGEYSLFVELKESGWTLIVSNQPYQEKYDPKEKVKTWGAYNYDPKHDVVRVPMTMVNLNPSHEQFTIGFVDVNDAGGKIAMGWEHTGATVPFTIAH